MGFPFVSVCRKLLKLCRVGFSSAAAMGCCSSMAAFGSALVDGCKWFLCSQLAVRPCLLGDECDWRLSLLSLRKLKVDLERGRGCVCEVCGGY